MVYRKAVPYTLYLHLQLRCLSLKYSIKKKNYFEGVTFDLIVEYI